MIEIEKKFLIERGNIEKLLKEARFIRQQKFTDTYYDSSDYALTKKDWWLRARNGIFELKIPYKQRRFLFIFRRPTDQYEELGTESEIKKTLAITSKNSLPIALEEKKYRPFATYTINRSKYMKDGFVIDISETDFGHRMAEIELNIDDPNEAKKAERQIIAFAKQHGLRFRTVRSRIVEYIRRTNAEHYRALRRSHVI